MEIVPNPRNTIDERRKEGEALPWISKGVLIDFGYTLAYIDKEDDRRCREGLVSTLRKYGYKKTLNDLSPLLDNAYRSSTKGGERY